ncbi:hypothetical protein JCM8547_001381 [Rhodosporidiobolus lusitaniae]
MSSALSYNYSLYSVPAVWGVGIGVHWAAIFLSKKSTEVPQFDNLSPRAYRAKLRELAKHSADAATILRIEAAQENIYENLGWYAAGIALANFARLPVKTLNSIAGAYVVSRILYSVLYAKVSRSQAYAGLRSLSYLVSTGLTISLFTKSGRALNALPRF